MINLVCTKSCLSFQKDSISKISDTVLIVSPGSVMYNWKEELETWGHFKMGLFHGNTKEDTLQRTLRGRLDVALTTYETMRNHLDDVNKVQWLAVIMDEVHRLKDPKSQITVAAKALRAKRRYGLTGTPLQNKLEEFW
ncbi:DNA excision repair protein ERCC-6-like 2 [Acropora cervicornis]|uniref:DNA excision repair protein ERCC-6-like 2 n=1 Tax=Acropora cervicornis TaxID=6130 RepID=A0AAD9QYW5_ACRCE|nr:DNA excision repair protein ERCC-6-like 2 [Acropora cervicornis]